MFSVRIAPWHQDETNSIVLSDRPDPALVLQVAGLDWQVEEYDIYRRKERQNTFTRVDGTVVTEPLPTFPKLAGWKLLTRSDTDTVLHVAKDSYEVAQNQVGADLMDALLGADSAVQYETGGSIFGGATCYLTARVDEPVVIDGDDSPTFPYVVVTWSHDGSGALQARATNIRVVCWNTLSFSEAEASRTGRKYTFRHTKNILARVEEAKLALGGVREEHAAFVELANELAAIQVSNETREKFVTSFIPAPEGQVVSDRVLDNISKARNQVRNLFEMDTIPDAHRHSAYGLVLAAGEYLDHLRGKNSNDTYLNRTLLRDEPFKKKIVPLVRELVAAA
jgi:phage/plasmid-like protein (TIGR03299 family)